jgi:hypothetical protein
MGGAIDVWTAIALGVAGLVLVLVVWLLTANID